MKKLKKNKTIKRVLGLSFCLAVLSPLALYFNQSNINDPPTQEYALKRLKTPNKARIDDETYTSYDIGYNTDYQTIYNSGIYEFYDTQDIAFTYVFRVSDIYAVVRDDESVNDGNIYGVGFRVDYDLFENDSDLLYNDSIVDYGYYDFYMDYNTIGPVPINKAYNLYNSNFNLIFEVVNEMLMVSWNITTSQGVYLESNNAVMLFDMAEYVQYDRLVYAFYNSYSVPVSSLYYAFNYGNNYQQGFTDGKQSVLGFLESSKTESYTEGYQKGYENAKNLYEDVVNNPMDWTKLATSIITLPSTIIKQGFDFDIFGVNVGEFIQTIIVISLVIFCVGLFTKGGSSG